MSQFADKFIKVFRSFLPAPFTIALVLTVLAFLVAVFSTGSEMAFGERSLWLLDKWETGLWNPRLLVFAFQMMLMLVLGHVLALSPAAEKVIALLSTRISSSTSQAAFFVCFTTMLVGFFNWGFGLIFGAILARKVGEQASRKGIDFNYPLIGAAGYAALMVWHGGLSGSSLIKVAEKGHLASLMGGILPEDQLALLPSSVEPALTMFSGMNLTASLLLLTIVPATLWFVAKRSKGTKVRIDKGESLMEEDEKVTGAERLDVMKWPAIFFGAVFLFMALWKAANHPDLVSFSWINPNWINLTLFGASLIAHGTIRRFLTATSEAIGGASGILIQFPLYFGIMGLITGSGLIAEFSNLIVANSSELTYPIFTFISAGIVNVFVPSGGGQWAVQGAIIVQSSMELGIPLAKGIMALAYGDQITNMLQPFWALPLLGITGLKAKDILPYTLLMMGVGALIFIAVLLFF
ncbi:MAG: TIGR00366 family protein [Flavobacteriales bacterium]|nr:TIGR00366 family protein [Flavobacteriales bacterium]